MLTITKSETYKVGIGGIRAVLGGDKKRAVDFENGKSIEVSEEEYSKIIKFQWCPEAKKDTKVKGVKDGN